MSAKKRIAILISGRGTNMVAIAKRAKSGDLNVHIAFVLADNPQAAGLQTAKEMGLQTFVVPYKHLGKQAAEQQISNLIDQYQVNLIVLAGFMKILSPDFTSHYENKILNIHPSLLPDFKGAHAIDDFWQTGGDTSGVTVHLVDQYMDHGQILAQKEVKRLPTDTKEDFEERIHQAEYQIYWATIAKYLNA